MNMEDKDISESGWEAVNAGISSLATQSQNNHEQVMTLLRSLVSDPESDHSETDSDTLGLGWAHSDKVTSLRGTIALLRAEISALDQQNIDQDAKLFLQDRTVDTLRESWSKTSSELSKSKETIQGLQEMISEHEEAKTEAEEEISRLSFSNKVLIRQLENKSDSGPASSWFSFMK
jgi:chromosome segregation ATPase